MDSSIDGKKLIEYQNEIIAKIKEKIEVKRFSRKNVDNGVVGSYIHFDKKSGCLLAISNVDNNQETMSVIRDLGMHVVALKPQYLYKEDIPEDVINKEKNILLEQPDLKNKPAEIAEKIVQGRINKFYSENCLIEQLFVKDDSKTVRQVVESLKPGAVLESFVFYELVAQDNECSC
jgi:elongation factor Ts